jgi:hypothetical protein
MCKAPRKIAPPRRGDLSRHGREDVALRARAKVLRTAQDGVPATGGDGGFPPHGGGTKFPPRAGTRVIPPHGGGERRGIRDACAQNAFLLFLEKEEKL